MPLAISVGRTPQYPLSSVGKLQATSKSSQPASSKLDHKVDHKGGLDIVMASAAASAVHANAGGCICCDYPVIVSIIDSFNRKSPGWDVSTVNAWNRVMVARVIKAVGVGCQLIHREGVTLLSQLGPQHPAAEASPTSRSNCIGGHLVTCHSIGNSNPTA